MASRFRPAKRRAPPNHMPLVDWGNPITRGMSLCAVAKGGTLVDVLSGIRGTLSGAGAPVAAPSPNGTDAMQYAGGSSTNSYVNFGTDVRSKDLIASGGTIFAWGRPTANGGIAERNAGNTIGAGWLFGIDVNLQLAFLAEYPIVNFTCGTQSGIPNDFPTSMAVAFDPQPLSTAYLTAYIAGQPQAMNQFAVGTGNGQPDGPYNQYIGRNSFSSAAPSSIINSYTGSMELIVMWNRRLSDAEIASLHADRGQIFAPTKVSGFDKPATGTTLAITGNAATGSPGTVGSTRSVKIGGGVHATGQTGNTTVPMTLGLTGVASTEGVSKVTPIHTVGLSGNTSAAGVGQSVPTHTVALSGNASTANVGQSVPALSVATAGVAATGDTGAVVAANTNITVGLTGNTATGAVGLIYFGVPPVLAEQTPTLIITSANTVDVSSAINNVETSVSL